MSFKDLISYIIKQFLWYVETPKDERKRKKQHRESWSMRWFGIVPLSMKMVYIQMKGRFPNRK